VVEVVVCVEPVAGVEADVVVLLGASVEPVVVVEADVVVLLDGTTVPMAGEVATVEPFLLVAVTTTRSVKPTSVATGI
jgi:hypothetical protein